MKHMSLLFLAKRKEKRRWKKEKKNCWTLLKLEDAMKCCLNVSPVQLPFVCCDIDIMTGHKIAYRHCQCPFTMTGWQVSNRAICKTWCSSQANIKKTSAKETDVLDKFNEIRPTFSFDGCAGARVHASALASSIWDVCADHISCRQISSGLWIKMLGVRLNCYF